MSLLFDDPREPVNAGRRIALGVAHVPGLSVQLLCSSHCIGITCPELGKVDPFVIFQHMLFQHSQNRCPALHSWTVSEVKEQPQLKAGIRDCQVDVVVGAICLASGIPGCSSTSKTHQTES